MELRTRLGRSRKRRTDDGLSPDERRSPSRTIGDLTIWAEKEE
jgi:hypothetical protein